MRRPGRNRTPLTAPSAAVPETPMIPGSASGLRSSPCRAAPLMPRLKPTQRTEQRPGRRSSTSTSAPSVGRPPTTSASPAEVEGRVADRQRCPRKHNDERRQACDQRGRRTASAMAVAPRLERPASSCRRLAPHVVRHPGEPFDRLDQAGPAQFQSRPGSATMRVAVRECGRIGMSQDLGRLARAARRGSRSGSARRRRRADTVSSGICP